MSLSEQPPLPSSSLSLRSSPSVNGIMRLSKTRRQSISSTPSTSSLPALTLDVSDSPSQPVLSASTTDVSDIAGRNHQGASSNGTSTVQAPPSSFSLRRTFTFGRKYRKGRRKDGGSSPGHTTELIPAPMLLPASAASSIQNPISPLPPAPVGLPISPPLLSRRRPNVSSPPSSPSPPVTQEPARITSRPTERQLDPGRTAERSLGAESSSLERNPSSSTTTSSILGPSTEESATCIQTPLDIVDSSATEGSQAALKHLVWNSSRERVPDETSFTPFDYSAAIGVSLLGTGKAKEEVAHNLLVSSEALKDQNEKPHPPLTPSSPTHSLTTSTFTHLTGSSSSTTRPKRALKVSTSDLAAGPSDQPISRSSGDAAIRRSVVFSKSNDRPSLDHRRDRPPIIRHRSTSLGGLSRMTNSMYSVAEIGIATGGIMTAAQAVHFSAGQSTLDAHDGFYNAVESLESASSEISNRRRETVEVVESFKASSDAVRRAFEVDKQSPKSRRNSYRPPPPPPHLARYLASESVRLSSPPVSSPSNTESVTPDHPSKRPPLPTRSSSLSRLWRRLSSGGAKQPSDTQPQTVNGSSKTLPSSHSPAHLAPSPVPEVPPAVSPVDADRLIKQASKGRLKPHRSGESKEKRRKAVTVSEVSPIPPKKAISAPQSPPQPRKEFDSPRRPFEPDHTAHGSLLLDLPLAASPLGLTDFDPLARSPLDGVVQDYFFQNHHEHNNDTNRPQRTTAGVSSAQDAHTREKRRRYRQTLFDIKDDMTFQRVLQDLAELDSTARTVDQLTSEVTGTSHLLSASVEDQTDDAHQESIRAWFVTREIVQGERRHGRLLARGLETVRAMAESLEYTGTLSASVPPIISIPVPKFRRRQKAASTDNHSHAEVDGTEDVLTSSSIQPLIDHLPRLLALSLTMSSRFGQDPSPLSVAVAFKEMESDLSKEIGFWAGEVGSLISKGLSGVLDRNTPKATPIHSRRGSLGTAGGREEGAEEDGQDKLGFADIILTPITRALRYKLLFNELLFEIPFDSPLRQSVHAALLAAERLARECDQNQTHDLTELRRKSSSSATSPKRGSRSRNLTAKSPGKGKGKGRTRPQSAGPPSSGSMR